MSGYILFVLGEDPGEEGAEVVDSQVFRQAAVGFVEEVEGSFHNIAVADRPS